MNAALQDFFPGNKKIDSFTKKKIRLKFAQKAFRVATT